MTGSGKGERSTMRENNVQNNWSAKEGFAEELTFKLWSEGWARVR